MMFLVRPQPFPDESLSSWRQRAGMANGFIRFPMSSTSKYLKDFDRFPSAAEEKWLCESYRIQKVTIERLSLEHLGNGAIIHFGQLQKPRWVIPIGKRYGGFGSVFCPKCLAEDVEPYFRLSWRLAFLSSCPTHGCRLVEHCCECGAAVWPAALRTLPAKQMKDFRHCPVCGESLTKCDSSHVGDRFSHPLFLAMTTGVIPAEFSQCLHISDLFDGFWCLCQLLIRRSSAKLHLALPFQSHRLESASHNIELLRLEHRRKILQGASWLMQDWPGRFVTAMRQARLSRGSIAKSRIPFPRWFSDVLQSDLSSRTCGVSRERISQAIRRIEDSGRTVSKSAVRRELDVTEALELDKVLSQRRRATWEEFELLCTRFENEVAVISTSRDQRASALRDYVLVLVAVLAHRKVEQVCLMSKEEVFNCLAGDYPPDRLGIIVRARAFNSEYEHTIRKSFSRRVGGHTPWFISRFGCEMKGHAVRTRVAGLMSEGFPKSLFKSIDVFLGIEATRYVDGL